MTRGSIVWGAPEWALLAALLAVAAAVVLAWAYWRASATVAVRVSAGLLKVLAVAALLVCLVEPLYSGIRPRPGANLFVLLADGSRSMQVRDQGRRQNRGDQLKEALDGRSAWQTRLSQDFDLRRYVFDTRLRPVADFESYGYDGNGSSLARSLGEVSARFRGRPHAGILLLTDGNATDYDEKRIDWSQLPPVYPVVIGEDKPLRDIRVTRVSVTQTNFEAAPVTIIAEVSCDGFSGREIVVQLLDEAGNKVQQHEVAGVADDTPVVVRFQFRPENMGVSFYTVKAFAKADARHPDDAQRSTEATLVNNSRFVMVDRGGGPYRVLYVSGRPNWEFKFLRRALQEDGEVDLVGLIRIAKREPKFTYRSRAGESTNPLFRGFGNQGDEQAEQYDEPVLIRIGIADEEGEELRDGFPKSADQLFRYHAVILDDLEAAFFSQDQLSLLQQFVSQRGGGFLMLGGMESFAQGGYHRTPVGEMLPVYLDRLPDKAVDQKYRFELTRDGKLQSWVRLRATEEEEKVRLGSMPEFRTLNRVQGIKPGATVLAHVQDPGLGPLPVLAVQRFGDGQSGALLIGDMWRWSLRRKENEENDLEKCWRQMVRWLVSDVPQRIEVDARRPHDDPSVPVEVTVQVRDEAYRPLDNAAVTLTVTKPDGKTVHLAAEPSDQKMGVYVASFLPQATGAYRATVVANNADGTEIGRRETGWTCDPATEEFARLQANRTLLDELARKSGGELVSLTELDSFVRSLPNRKIPITEPWIYPLWHQWSVFVIAIACLVGEWGLRRWKGLP